MKRMWKKIRPTAALIIVVNAVCWALVMCYEIPRSIRAEKKEAEVKRIIDKSNIVIERADDYLTSVLLQNDCPVPLVHFADLKPLEKKINQVGWQMPGFGFHRYRIEEGTVTWTNKQFVLIETTATFPANTYSFLIAKK